MTNIYTRSWIVEENAVFNSVLLQRKVNTPKTIGHSLLQILSECPLNQTSGHERLLIVSAPIVDPEQKISVDDINHYIRRANSVGVDILNSCSVWPGGLSSPDIAQSAIRMMEVGREDNWASTIQHCCLGGRRELLTGVIEIESMSIHTTNDYRSGCFDIVGFVDNSPYDLVYAEPFYNFVKNTIGFDLMELPLYDNGYRAKNGIPAPRPSDSTNSPQWGSW